MEEVDSYINKSDGVLCTDWSKFCGHSLAVICWPTYFLPHRDIPSVCRSQFSEWRRVSATWILPIMCPESTNLSVDLIDGRSLPGIVAFRMLLATVWITAPHLPGGTPFSPTNCITQTAASSVKYPLRQRTGASSASVTLACGSSCGSCWFLFNLSLSLTSSLTCLWVWPCSVYTSNLHASVASSLAEPWNGLILSGDACSLHQLPVVHPLSLDILTPLLPGFICRCLLCRNWDAFSK